MNNIDENLAGTDGTTVDANQAPVPRRSLLAYLPMAVFAVVAAMFIYSLMTTSDPSLVPSVLIGKPAPRLTLPALDGIADHGVAVPGVTPADFVRGKPVIVNFWQSSCAPCVGEHPILIELHDKTGVPIIGIDYKDVSAGARRFLNRYGVPFDAVGVDADGRAAIEWGVYGMPETFIVNGRGVIVAKHIGAITEEQIDSEFVPALAKAREAQ